MKISQEKDSQEITGPEVFTYKDDNNEITLLEFYDLEWWVDGARLCAYAPCVAIDQGEIIFQAIDFIEVYQGEIPSLRAKVIANKINLENEDFEDMLVFTYEDSKNGVFKVK